ncbi:radical SAM protein [Desulfotomaculum copahuensis]|uniref:Radical SAM protein n=1 Tax=Desulfotomaculum copahuensis TaxID=1838280 RepID=A0A1B7LE89_9FIRM|nr:radical SAM protein [Desulfotomaculum copahuensis]OAT81365.1 radical SAM protein [Desulfotomaculum copahuensis]
MFYEEPVFRPPSEANSLILQATTGCAHNACAFCGMYKGKMFRVRSREEIQRDINEAAAVTGGRVKRLFLADGDVLAMETGDLLDLLSRLNRAFPYLERVAGYAGPRDLLAKTPAELSRLRKAGLQLLYLGVESGHDQILKKMAKGVDAAGMIRAGRAAIEAGFTLSVTVITGLGGREQSLDHARATARVINAINPHFLSALTLMVLENTSLYHQIKAGKFTLLTPLESLREIAWLLEDINLSGCLFRSNHASNYLPLKGKLNDDREKLLALLKQAIKEPGRAGLRPEFLRGL